MNARFHPNSFPLGSTRLDTIQIHAVTDGYDNPLRMKRRLTLGPACFSLVEVTLALGVAAFSLIALLGLLPAGIKTQQTSIQQTTANQIISQIFSFLRADVRLPPGQANKVCGNTTCQWENLHGHPRNLVVPATVYVTDDAKQTGPV